MTVDPMELDPLDPRSPRSQQVDIVVRGRSGIVPRKLRVEAMSGTRNRSGTLGPADPAALLDQVAAACRVGCFGPPAAAAATLTRVPNVSPATVTGELAFGATHPSVLRSLARMGHAMELARLHISELAIEAELVDVASIIELPTPSAPFQVAGRRSVEEKSHSFELRCSPAEAYLPAVHEIVEAWSSLVEAGAFRGDNAPWCTGFLVEVARAGRESIVASFEYLNLHESALDPLVLALSQLPAATGIRALDLS